MANTGHSLPSPGSNYSEKRGRGRTLRSSFHAAVGGKELLKERQGEENDDWSSGEKVVRRSNRRQFFF